ncbi:hypothetical protein RJ641_007416 [Dillenia turbinata]|uniref:Uncharacterized protein n=1 Tax=Dillenia turbinata TaxID=194707 RepID=A0AAN8Z5I7_9MAGN
MAHSQILNTDPFPSLSHAYALVAQEERQRSIVSSRLPSIESTTFMSTKTSKISVLLNCLSLLATLLIILNFKKGKPKAVQARPTIPAMNLPDFTYQEMEEATDGFKEVG